MELIPIGGQMSGWRWYFRITTAVMCVYFLSTPVAHEMCVAYGGQYSGVDLVDQKCTATTGRGGKCAAQVEATGPRGITFVSARPLACSNLGPAYTRIRWLTLQNIRCHSRPDP